MSRSLITMIVCLLCPLAAAAPNYEADCSALAKQKQIDSSELKAFKQWCAFFEESCYKLEARAADACGSGGKLSAKAEAIQQSANGAVKAGGAAYTTGGRVTDQSCPMVAAVRDEQRQTCDREKTACVDKRATFPSSKVLAVVQCYKFGPENSKWSPTAKAANSICNAIATDLANVTALADAEQSQCGKISGIVNSASGQGATTSNNVEKPSPTKTSYEPRNPTSPAYNPNHGGEPNQQEMPFPDVKACGPWGCKKNANGSYSPTGPH